MIDSLLLAVSHKDRTALAYVIPTITTVEHQELLEWTRERLQGKSTLVPHMKVSTAILLQVERWLLDVPYPTLAVRTALVFMMSMQ